jgi:hypothetical protein
VRLRPVNDDFSRLTTIDCVDVVVFDCVDVVVFDCVELVVFGFGFDFVVDVEESSDF